MTFPAHSIYRVLYHIVLASTAMLFLTAPLEAADPSGQAPPAAYRIAVGDVLSFDILDDPDIPASLTIGTDGAVAFPLLGAVKIEGKTIPETVAMLRSEYLSRQLLTEPNLSLTIVSVQPVRVLGEVRTPGSYTYYRGLTVEQAVGLAGGTQSAMSNPADRMLAQAKLRGAILETDVEIVREAIYAARLYAQLRGSAKIDLKDVPESVKKYVDNTAVGPVVALEEKILKTDLQSTANQIEILNQGIAQTDASLTILDKLKAQQEEVVTLNEQAVERTIALRKRELNTETELSRVKTATSNEKSRLLEIYAEIGRSSRELGNLKLQLATLQANREKEILTLLQEREATLKKLETVRRTTQEQYVLIGSTAIDASKQEEISFLYRIDRDDGKARHTMQASPVTEVLPGDVVFVSIAGM